MLSSTDQAIDDIDCGMSRNQIRPEFSEKLNTKNMTRDEDLCEKYIPPKKIEKLRDSHYLDIIDTVRSIPTTFAKKRIIR